MGQIDAYGYFFCEAGKPLQRREFSIEPTEDDRVVVEVAGCGLCHTDISFYSGQVATKHALPLVLGHEISGTVVAGGPAFAHLIGRNVIVPAVLPCGECELCNSGRDNICRQQLMPGNDFDGGFASHLLVPGRFLCPVADELGDFSLPELSVIADAITTPYQSLVRSGLEAGDLAIVIGTGGIGIYMAQLASLKGATVIALDIDQHRLDQATEQGADFGISVRDLSEKEIKGQIRALVKAHNLPQHKWKVFETSGTAAGQQTAFSLLSFAGTVGVIGFTMEKIPLRLSNVMAFDADLFGNWGCRPAYYPDVLQLVLERRITLKENIELHPLETINDVIGLALNHQLQKRAIFVPNGKV